MLILRMNFVFTYDVAHRRNAKAFHYVESYGEIMRKCLSIFAVVFLVLPALSHAQESTFDADSVEYKIAQTVDNAASSTEALELLLSAENEILSDAQKVALRALPEAAQQFFLEIVSSGVSAADAALTTASTQPNVTTDMGTELYDAFVPQLAQIEDEDREGNLIETAANGTATGPIGFGTGSGGGGGGGAAASNN